MNRKNSSANLQPHRLFIFVAICSVAGMILGGTASRAEMKQCLAAETLSNECLTQDSTTKIIEGMGGGLIAGVGAAIAITWQSWQRNDS